MRTPESAADLIRRRRIVALVSVAGGALLGRSLSTRPGSREFYALTLGVAGTWTVGGLLSGPLHLGRGTSRRRPVLGPVLVGGTAFSAFYGCALVVRHIPLLDGAVRRVLRYERLGSSRAVMITTLVNGVAEEVFFRGALYAAVDERHPVALSTFVYALATASTRNPALVLASGVMGSLFGWQRQRTGGVQAPLLTHVTWSALMLRYLPPLFRDRPGAVVR